MNQFAEWTPEETEELLQLISQNSEGSNQEYANRLTEKFNRKFSSDSVKSKRRRLRKQNGMSESKVEAEKPENFKESVEINSDGSLSSNRLVKMSFEDSKDPAFLLKAHGYDMDAWELITARSNIWNAYSKQDGIMQLYSSKITVKPKVNGFNWNSLIEKLSNVPSVIVKQNHLEIIERYLNLPLFDMHFGISSYDTYKETQTEILTLVETGYTEILIIVGQDLLHTDNFRGQTASGTQIGKIDMEQAWEDAARFYEPIIVSALRSKTKIMYSKGNHDESMSWAFVKYLKGKFPQAEFDTSFKERKVHMLGLNFVGVNHGDKKNEENLTENFSTEFPLEWSKAKTREIFTGHKHHERVIDKRGTVIRRMPTGNEIDDYHDDYGYTTAHKRFQVFEYSGNALKRIHYV